MIWSDVGSGLVLLVATSLLLFGAEASVRYTKIKPEQSRKAVHFLAGLSCLSFPFLFQSAVSLLLLAIAIGGGIYLAERGGRLQSLCRVSRTSKGSLYYPLAIAGLFYLARDNYRLYASAIFVLIVADSAAALVGARWGRHRFRVGTAGESKSLEGSLTFYALAFLSVLIPLVWPSGNFGVGAALLAAFLAATLLTFVEASATGGIDNLYIPILTAFFLIKMADKPIPELAMQSGSLLLVCAFLAFLNWHGRLLRSKDLITMTIIVYGIWSLGSMDWAIPLMMAYALFVAVFMGTGSDPRRTLVHRRMVLLSAPAAAITLAANLTGLFPFFYAPFLAAVLVPSIWGGVMQLRMHAGCERSPSDWSLRQWGVVLAMLVGILWQPVTTGRAPDMVAVLALILVCVVVVCLGILLMHRTSWPGGGVALAATVLAALVLMTMQYVHITAFWQPARWDAVYGREMEVLLPVPPAWTRRSP